MAGCSTTRKDNADKNRAHPRATAQPASSGALQPASAGRPTLRALAELVVDVLEEREHVAPRPTWEVKS